MGENARAAARLVALDAGQILFMRGDRPRSMYYVLAGEVRLVRSTLGGDEHVLQRARDGFLAEASLDQPRYHCDARASAAATLLAIPRAVFVAALDLPAVRVAWTSLLVRELRRVRAHSERLGLKTARARITHYIETEGSAGAVTLTTSRREWAADLGLTHEALYRALATMARAGELTAEGRMLRLRSGA